MKKSTLTKTKMLFAAFCCFALTASVKAQTFSILPAKTASVTLACDSMAVETVIEDSISNPTLNDLTLSYQVVSNTFPAPWTVTFCDWINCYPTVPVGVKNITDVIPAGSHNKSIILHVASNATPGQGSFVLNLWQTSAPTNSLTITWNAISYIGAGISESVNNTSFITYPNPTEDFVNVEITSGYSKTGSIQVYNFVGDKIMEFNGIRNNVQKIDLTKLPAGAYFVKYYNGEGTSVKKIFKTR